MMCRPMLRWCWPGILMTGGEATLQFARELGLIEAFTALHGTSAKSFPAQMPVLSLDRVYLRGFTVQIANVLGGVPGPVYLTMPRFIRCCTAVRGDSYS